jgi:hypothetical protein
MRDPLSPKKYNPYIHKDGDNFEGCTPDRERMMKPGKKPPLIFKDKHTKETGNFFQMNNAAIQDPRLSLAAKGLLAYFLSKPETWEIHFRSTMRETSTGRTALEAYLEELKGAGYVKKIQGTDYRNDTKYVVYENPDSGLDLDLDDLD